MIKSSTSQEEILKLAPACSCNQCNHGCTMGSGFLAKGDKQRIAKHFNITEKELEKKHLESITLFNKEMWRPKILRGGKPYGPCTFFKEGKCSIHEVKPLECKISMGCKEYGEKLSLWFMENHILNKKDEKAREEYEIYKKTGGKVLPL